jgi:hypothetical protein
MLRRRTGLAGWKIAGSPGGLLNPAVRSIGFCPAGHDRAWGRVSHQAHDLAQKRGRPILNETGRPIGPGPVSRLDG